MSRMKRIFEKKQKTFFLVSKVLSFRYAKQTSKNVEGITFKTFLFSCNEIVIVQRLICR